MKKIVEGAAKVPATARHAAAKLSGAHGVLNTLAKEHAEVSAALKLIHVERKRGAHMRDAKHVARVRLLTTVSLDLLAHAHAEEEVVYDALLRFPEAAERMRASRDEHRAMEGLLHELLSIPYSSERWLEVYEELIDTVERHVAEEEGEVFELAQRLLTRDELEELDERYARTHKAKRLNLEGRSFRLAGEGPQERHAP